MIKIRSISHHAQIHLCLIFTSILLIVVPVLNKIPTQQVADRSVRAATEFLFLVDTEDHDAVAVLIGHKTEFPRRVDIEIPRCFDITDLMLDICKLSISGIDLVNHNAVMPAIRSIKKFPARMHAHLSAIVLTLEIFR